MCKLKGSCVLVFSSLSERRCVVTKNETKLRIAADKNNGHESLVSIIKYENGTPICTVSIYTRSIFEEGTKKKEREGERDEKKNEKRQ